MNEVIGLLGWALIHSLWWGTGVAVVFAVFLKTTRRTAPTVRYAAAWVAMASLVVGPITISVLSEGRGIHARSTPAPAEAPTLSAAAETDLYASTAEVVTPILVDDSSSASWLDWLAGAWAVGAGLFALRLGMGWCGAQRLRYRGTQPLTALDALRLNQLASQLGVWRSVQFLETSVATVPAVVGWIRPVVLIPVELVRELSPPQLEAIILHELAHIRRHDYVVNLLQRVVEVLLFYHPAVWWLSRVIEAERERCCDDLVVAARAEPGVYAGALVSSAALAGQLEGRWAPASTGGHLSDRIRRLLDRSGRPPTTQRRTLASLMTFASGTLIITCALVLVVACSSIATEDREPLESVRPDTVQADIIRVPWGRLMRGEMQYNIAILPGDVIRIPAQGGGFLYLTGHVTRPGAYTVPGINQLTLKQLIASSGGIPEADGQPVYYTVTRRVDEDTEVVALTASWEQLGAGEAKDTYLYPGDVIEASIAPPKAPILVTPSAAIPAKPELLGRLPRGEDLVAPNSITPIDKIHSGDKLRVTIFGLLKPTENHVDEPTVDENGRIELVVLGEVDAAGLTVTELRQRLVEKATSLGVFRDTPVQIEILSSGQTFTILGEPEQGSTRPGVYELPKSGYSLLEAIAEAGGISSSTEAVYVYRGTQPVKP